MNNYPHPKTNIVEMWKCYKECEDAYFKDGAFEGDGKHTLYRDVSRLTSATFEGTIGTDFSGPFYVFERNDDYYFLTLSGRIYVAPSVAVDSKKIERLIGQLDSENYSIREKATRELRTIGKPAHIALETHLLRSYSPEQRRRIAQLLEEMKPLTDRETKLRWGDEKRPVDKLLFDQDKNKIYAFTKPNREKQVYFFEINDKPPQPRLFTGNIAPDSPASVPASTRLFLEYARFVRSAK